MSPCSLQNQVNYTTNHRSCHPVSKLKTPGYKTRGLSYEFSAAGVTATAIAVVITATTSVAIAAATPNDNQQNDDPTAVIAAKTRIAHIGTSYELLTAEAVTPHTMRNTKSGSCFYT